MFNCCGMVNGVDGGSITDSAMRKPATVVLKPMPLKNFNAINAKIKYPRFKLDDDNSANLYCILTNEFKTNYTLEGINDIIFNTVSEFGVSGVDCFYSIDNTKFTIIPYFTYTKVSPAEMDSSENLYNVFPWEDQISTFVPGVTGVSLFVFFDNCDKQSIKNSQMLLNKIDNALLKTVYVTKQERFFSFHVEDDVAKNMLIDKLSKKFQKYNVPLQSFSFADDRLKLRCSELSLKIISEFINDINSR